MVKRASKEIREEAEKERKPTRLLLMEIRLPRQADLFDTSPLIAGLFDAYPKPSSTKMIAGIFDAYSLLEIGTISPPV